MNDFNYRSHVQRHQELLRERENDRLVKQVLSANRQDADHNTSRLFNAFVQWIFGVMKRPPAIKQIGAGVKNKKVIHEPGA